MFAMTSFWESKQWENEHIGKMNKWETAQMGRMGYLGGQYY